MKNYDLRKMTIILNGKMVTIYGGPYMQKPEDMFGVKMAAEINRPCDVNIPTRDFSVPEPSELLDGLEKTVRHLNSEDSRPVYVGCMGGIGRTGLFMAALTKASKARPRFVLPFLGGFMWTDGDGEDAINTVREQYKSHAIETEDQEIFIEELDTVSIGKRIYSGK